MKKLLLIFLMFFSVNVFSQQKLRCDIDSDKDGVADCFDKCLDSLHNERVDSKGCPLDTDGDGVADYKDEQLITPSECQPSDSNGVGKCDYTCSKNEYVLQSDGSVFKGQIHYFSSNSIRWNSQIANMLDSLSIEMRRMPNFKVVIAIYGTDIALINYEKLKSKINTYMDVEKEINIERIIFKKNITSKQSYIVIRNPHDGE